MNRLVRAVLSLFAAPRVNMREDYEKVRRLQRQLAARPLPSYRVLDRTIVSDDGAHEVPVRVFWPKERTSEDVLLFFHGGGWVTGDIESYTPACSTMADLTGRVVASVDYRLAPEHPFPAGLQDCYGAARVLLDDPGRVGIRDAGRVVLVGDSAGANLAAVVSLLSRDAGHRVPDRQILLYPVTAADHDPEASPFASVREYGEGLRLTNTEVEDYLELYVPDPERRRDPLVAPLLASDLADQPRTLVITAELDLLRDEGEAYGRALADAGGDVTIHRVGGAIHGFISQPRFSRWLQEGYEVIGEFLSDVPRESAPAAGEPSADEDS